VSGKPTFIKTNGRNVEWEHRVLDCIFLAPQLLRDFVPVIKPEHFFLDHHRLIFHAMRHADKISRVSIYDMMKSKGHEVEYCEYEKTQLYPHSVPADFSYYVQRMKTEHCVREAAHRMNDFLTAITNGDGILPEELRRLADMIPASVNGDEMEVLLKSFDSIEKEHVRWLWPKYLPLGRLIHLAGESGEGKSPVTLDLIARISSGADWPDGTKNEAGPRSVILLSAEDDVRDTIRPRLELAGADLTRVFDVRCTVRKGQSPYEKLLALDRDTNKLIERAREVRGLGAMFIDPITNYLGSAQMKVEEEIRKLLMPVLAGVRELEVLGLTVGHLNRRERGTSPLQRIMGAAAFHGIARVIYFAGRDPEDADKHAHVLVQQRGFAAPSLRYRTTTKPLTWDGITEEIIQIEWRGTSSASGQDVVDPTADSEKKASADAATELRNIISAEGGCPPAETAKQQLTDAGFDINNASWSRIMHRAGAVSRRHPGERFYRVQLPATAARGAK
jgi:hypothetical protein